MRKICAETFRSPGSWLDHFEDSFSEISSLPLAERFFMTDSLLYSFKPGAAKYHLTNQHLTKQ